MGSTVMEVKVRKKGIESVDVASLSKRHLVISILLIGLMFFIIGFVSWINAILIPYFKIACELINSLQ